MFSSSILLQILACALYNNWWPMLSGETGYDKLIMLLNIECIKIIDVFFYYFFYFLVRVFDFSCRWIDAAKFLTGASAVGSFAIPIILRHVRMISTGAMFIEFTSFIIFVCTVLCFHRASLEDDW
ncbi:vacuolar protein sorting-associated protein 55 homolog isoform X2 [Hibiscus syriacus]|nr:vacuolar protein sorting-associated protein 55 homolog isoform X2 [Hibiscus syriacus]XP_039068299.1 vacuolar protein sorting-associated protein 55 homolog isoform X2 [Hibiscus syriacus]